MVTIFTPTYNRASFISRLYESLLAQTIYDFEWIIVDDGSRDNTTAVVNLFISQNTPFPIVYHKQENGGKCRAINKGVELAKGELFFIVDSDDYLDSNAIMTISNHQDKILNDESFCALGFLRVNPDNSVVGGEIDYKELDTDFLSYRYQYHNKGDRAEVIKTKVMRDFPFPTYENEKFLSEAVVWFRIAQTYNCKYLNYRIYVCDYQQGGLSDSSSRLFSNNPKGSMLYYKQCYGFIKTIKHRLVFASLFWRFRFSTDITSNPELQPYASMYLYLLFYPFYLLIRKIAHMRRKDIITSLKHPL